MDSPIVVSEGGVSSSDESYFKAPPRTSRGARPASPRDFATDESSSQTDGLEPELSESGVIEPVVRRPGASPLKRKRSHSRRAVIKRTRLTGVYVDEYRKLFNEDVRHLHGDIEVPQDNRKLQHSQIGSVIWTAGEKHHFFRALTRLGTDAIVKIAAIVGTKTSVEVHDYLQLLREGSAEYTLSHTKRSLSSYADLPAATEVSDSCCEKLEVAADALAWYENSHAMKKEKQRHGEGWLLTQTIADEIDAALGEYGERTDASVDDLSPRHEPASDEDTTEHGHEPTEMDFPPATHLLNLSNWLELSRNVFMNSSGPDHWQNIAESQEEPSLFSTAFEDFHRLTISITKRLISATLFKANARLRSEDWRRTIDPTKDPKAIKPQVRAWDVRSAAEVLKMKPNSKQFWAEMPRRLKVNVPAASYSARFRAYDEVEAKLGFPTRTSCSSELHENLHEQEDCEDNSKESYDELSSDVVDESASEGESEEDSLLNDEVWNAKSHAKRLRKHELEEDARAELKDDRQSRLEEAGLWDTLGQTPPGTLLHEQHESKGSTGKREVSHNSRQDPASWRDHLEYCEPWVKHGAVSISTMLPLKTFNDELVEKPQARRPERSRTPLLAEQVPKISSKANTKRQVPFKSSASRPTSSHIDNSEAAIRARARKKRQENEWDGAVWDDSEPEVILPVAENSRSLPPRGARHAATTQIGETDYADMVVSSSDEFEPDV